MNPHPPTPSPVPSLPPSPGEGETKHLSGPLPWLIAWRFLRGRQSRLLDGTARAALLSTALGVMAMIIAMALMTGYRQDLQSKLVRGNAAVIAYPVGGETGALSPERRRKLLAIPGVRAVLTHEHVPGQKTYGMERADQPVLAWQHVRYQGEPVAIVRTGAELPTRQMETRPSAVPVAKTPPSGLQAASVR